MAQQLRLCAEPRLRRLQQLRDQGRSEPQQQDADVLPLRLQHARRDAVHQRHHDRAGAGRPVAARADQPYRRRRLGPDHGDVGRLQRPRRTEPVPGAGPLRSRPVVQSGRAGLSAVAHQPAAEQGVSAHQRHGLSGTRARRPQQRNDDRAERAAESHLGAGAAQSAWRPRHAAHLVHPRDQRQPLRDELRQPLHAARLQSERDAAERQLDRVVPARRRQRRTDRQQLLSDVPLELLRAVGAGRLATHRSPDAQPRTAVGQQFPGLRGSRIG